MPSIRLTRSAVLLAAFASAAAALPRGAQAHDSPATTLYLNYRLDPEVPEIVATIEGATQHFGPLAEVSAPAGDEPPDAVPFAESYLEFIGRECPVTVDGAPLEPQLREFSFLPLEDEILPGRPGKLVLVLSVVTYPLEEVPDVIDVRWSAFPVLPDGFTLADFEEAGHVAIDQVFPNYQVGDGAPEFVGLTRDSDSFVWDTRAPGSDGRPDPADRVAELQFAHYIPRRDVPVSAWLVSSGLVALLVLGASSSLRTKWPWKVRWRIAFALVVVGFVARHHAVVARVPLPGPGPSDTLTDDEAVQLFAALHDNIYAAFDAGDEEAVYDALSQSVAGPLLGRVYAEVYRSLVLEEADGTKATVQEIDRESVLPQRTPGGDAIDFDTGYTVEGVVRHLNHIHLRVNRYSARYRMEPVEGLWKITGAEQLSAERVTAEESPDPDAEPVPAPAGQGSTGGGGA